MNDASQAPAWRPDGVTTDAEYILWLEEALSYRQAGELQFAEGIRMAYRSIGEIVLLIGDERAIVTDQPLRSLDRITERLRYLERELSTYDAIAKVVIDMSEFVPDFRAIVLSKNN